MIVCGCELHWKKIYEYLQIIICKKAADKNITKCAVSYTEVKRTLYLIPSIFFETAEYLLWPYLMLYNYYCLYHILLPVTKKALTLYLNSWKGHIYMSAERCLFVGWIYEDLVTRLTYSQDVTRKFLDQSSVSFKVLQNSLQYFR